MDPFSAEGELVNIHNAFHQGQYQEVVDFDTSSLSAANALPARVLKLRAQIELGQAAAVISDVKGEAASSPDLAAVLVFAQHIQKPDADAPRAKAEELSQSSSDNLTVQLLCGTVLARSGMAAEALTLLGRHQGSLDAVALITQIHLSQNRLDLAQQTVRQARSYSQDSLLINLAEAWVGLREGGEKYQAAFYVFEELATAPATTSPRSLLAQAVAETHLGRLPEAEAAMAQALEKAPQDPDVLADAVVLNTILGNDTSELRTRLAAADASHPMLQEVERKKELFETARAKYTPKFEVEA